MEEGLSVGGIWLCLLMYVSERRREGGNRELTDCERRCLFMWQVSREREKKKNRISNYRAGNAE